MRRGFALGLVGLVIALACDDGHKVGDDIGVGGRGGATGGKSAKGGGANLGLGGSGNQSLPGIAGFAGALIDEVCNSTPTQFEFTVDDPSKYCTRGYYGTGIQILSADGQNVTRLMGQLCSQTRCSTCNDVNSCITLAIAQSEVGSEPRTETWYGDFDVAGTCGVPEKSCLTNRCLTAGRYVAKYCLAPKGGLSTCSEWDPNKFIVPSTCVEVPFDYPTTEVVRGQITTPETGGAGGAGPAGSGGTAGASGTTVAGGNLGTAGAAGIPSIVDEICTWPAVQFEFTVDDPSLYCARSDYATANEVFGGIRILATDGQAVTVLGAPSIRTMWTCTWPRCATCSTTCLTGEPYQYQVTSTPRTGQWDGGFDATGTCGASNRTCYATHCVQPGQYVAKYCLVPKYDMGNCIGQYPLYSGKETACVEVPFDFPTTEVVRGQITKAMIPPNTAGAAGAGGTGGYAGSAGGTTGTAGAPACLPGCNLESKSSLFCPSERSHAWVCGASPNVYAQMLAAGCTDAATGAIRYCCPPAFQTQCP